MRRDRRRDRSPRASPAPRPGRWPPGSAACRPRTGAACRHRSRASSVDGGDHLAAALIGRQGLQRRALAVQPADAGRAVQLVAGEDVEVAVQRLDVRRGSAPPPGSRRPAPAPRPRGPGRRWRARRLTVPSTFDMWVTATSRVRRPDQRRPGRHVQRPVVQHRGPFQHHAHAARAACARARCWRGAPSGVTMISSPGWSDWPSPAATRLIASVPPLVQTIWSASRRSGSGRRSRAPPRRRRSSHWPGCAGRDGRWRSCPPSPPSWRRSPPAASAPRRRCRDRPAACRSPSATGSGTGPGRHRGRSDHQSRAVSHDRTTSLAPSWAIRSTTSIRKAWVSRARASSAGMPRCCM